MDTVLNDLRYAIRGLRRDPVFTVAALLTLGLALGANAAIFTLSHALLFRRLPYAEPDRIVEMDQPPLSFEPNGFRLRAVVAENPLLASTSLYYPGGGANLESDAESFRVRVAQVDVSFLRTMGSSVLIGRDFLEEEGSAGANGAVLISERVWRDRFGADPAVVGTEIRVNAQPHTVVGVLPANFEFPAGVDAWIPTPLNFEYFGAAAGPIVLGRLRGGTTIGAAESAMRASIEGERPRDPGDRVFRLIPLREQLTSSLRAPVFVLLAAVLMVVVIGCVNLSGLMLSRVSNREREFAVRGALGAGAGRIAGQLLAEALLLAVLGGTLAMLLAWWTLDAIVALFPPTLFPTRDFAPGAATSIYTGIVAAIVAFLFTLAPAVQASRVARRIPRHSGIGEDAGRSRLRSGLLVAEIALTFVLIVGSGLMVRTMMRLHDVPLGFEPDAVLTVKLRLPESRYDGPGQTRFTESLLERVRDLPGIEGAAAASDIPLSGAMGAGYRVLLPEDVDPSVDRQFDGESASYRVATTDWFRVMRIPVVAGRAFAPEDGRGELVFVINEPLATRLFPGGDAVGRRLALYGGRNARFGTVVGVVEGVRHERVTTEARPEIYLPFGQSPVPYVSVAARVPRDRGAAADAMAAAVRELDSGIPLYEVRMMGDVVTASLGSRRGLTVVMTMFGLLAMLVSAVGLYGVIAQSVAQRRREIGVRVALGAARAGILGLVLRRGLRVAAGGTLFGAIGAAGVTRFLRSQLFEVQALDPATFLVVALLTTGVAVVASAVPAVRAARVDPMTALRQE